LLAQNQENQPQNSHEDDPLFGNDALDLLLGKDSAGVIIRNLISFALRGSTSAQAGWKAEKIGSVRAYALAIAIFEQFRVLYPSVKALNPDHIPLSKVQQDLVPKICLAIKMHYRKLLTSLVDKVRSSNLHAKLRVESGYNIHTILTTPIHPFSLMNLDEKTWFRTISHSLL